MVFLKILVAIPPEGIQSLASVFVEPAMSPSKAFLGVLVVSPLLCQCASLKPKGDELVVSVSDQRLVLLNDGVPVKSYPVSTSKFGLGSRSRSYKTPLGEMYVHQKIGDGATSGTVFKSRRPTGEVLRPNAPGRDPIVSRILWLEGKERSNHNTRERMIYIHGTPEERTIGRPASYGCIRMKSRDVIDLYDRIPVGADVSVKRRHLRVAEIPSADRRLIASARSREAVSPGAGRPAGRVVYAAARPARPPANERKIGAGRVAPVVGGAGVEPRRRGAFTRLPTITPARPVAGGGAPGVAYRGR